MPTNDGGINREIGRRIREIRAKMSQENFAEVIGVSRSYVSNLEKGVSAPSLELLMKISESFDVSTDWILFGKPAQTKKVEVIIDSDLKDMIDFLKFQWLNADSDMRGWIKIQFRTAFAAFYDWSQKKHTSSGESTTNGA